jgi:hypothetical protein
MKGVRIMIDKELLLEEADAITVAEYLGMEMQKKGSNIFICCPGHEKRLGKPDTRISNCVLVEKGYKCFACNKYVGVIDMVMEYTGCSYPEALTIVADACGGVALYDSDEKHVVFDKLPLSMSDMELLGLKPRIQEYPVLNASDQEFEIEDYLCRCVDGEFLMYEKRFRPSLNKMYRDNRRGYNILIAAKAKEAISKYEAAIEAYCSKDASKANLIFDIFNTDGYLDSQTMVDLKAIFQKRLWRLKEIYDNTRAGVSK